ncbi:hypothetical protein WJX79_000787 [Trebouxia sp. C0005]
MSLPAEPNSISSSLRWSIKRVREGAHNASAAIFDRPSHGRILHSHADYTTMVGQPSHSYRAYDALVKKAPPPPPPPPPLLRSSTGLASASAGSSNSSSTRGKFSRAGLAVCHAPSIVSASAQATNRAVFVPLAPQGRYTGLGGTNPQRFIPQPLASEPVHAESTIHTSSTLDGTLTMQVAEAAQQQQHSQPQCVYGEAPNGVGHLLHHTEVAVTRGAIDEPMEVQLREAFKKEYAHGLTLACYAFLAQQYREQGCSEHQIEAWLLGCGICIPVYRYSMTQYHDSFMQWYHGRAAHQMALETRQTAVTSAASAPAGVPRVSSAGQDYQAGAKAAGGDGSQAAAGADLEETVDHEVAQTVDELITAAVADFFALDNGASQPADPAMASSGAVPANMHDSFSAPTQGAAGSAGISPAAVVSVALAAGTGSVCRSDRAIHGSSATSMRLLPHSDLTFMHEREAVREREVEQMRQQVTEMEDACKVAVEREVGYRKDQIARLQCGKQVCYGSQDMAIALAEGEEAILWAQRADATRRKLEVRLNGLETAVAGLKQDKAALQQHVRSLVMAPTSCGGAAESSSNDSCIESLSSEQEAAEASIQDQRAQQHAQLLAAKSEEHAALMGDLAAAHEAATVDKAEVMAPRQELQLLRPSDASSQQQSQSEEEEDSQLEVAHTLLGLSEWKVAVLSGLVQREGINVEMLFDMTAAFSFASNVNPSTAEMVLTSSLSLGGTAGVELSAEFAAGDSVGDKSAPFVIPFTGPSHAEDELPLPVILPFTGADSNDFDAVAVL